MGSLFVLVNSFFRLAGRHRLRPGLCASARLTSQVIAVTVLSSIDCAPLAALLHQPPELLQGLARRLVLRLDLQSLLPALPGPCIHLLG